MASEVIQKGKSVIPPSYDYELEKKPVSGGIGLTREMEYIVNKLSAYLGYPDKTDKLLGCLYRLENRINALVDKNTKKVNSTESSNDFISLLYRSVSNK
jgi:hypothetical protein